MKEFINLRDLFKLQNIFLLVLSISALFYTGYRCFFLSFTHDESYSFIKYIDYGILDLITYHIEPAIANNHSLNTISMKVFGGLFGNSEFVLRLHSFIAHILYLIFTYLILKESNSRFILLFGFIILNCNIYLLDFFSLARGYSMSISLMLMSIYYFVKFSKQPSSNYYLIVSLIASIIAVLANFSLISFSASLIVTIELFLVLSKHSLKLFLKRQIPLVLTAIILFLIYIGPIKILLSHNELNFGGTKGLWDDTVISSIDTYLYNSVYFDTLTYFLRFLVIIISVSSCIVVFKQLQTRSETIFTYVTIILFLILIVNVTQHLFLGGSYFRERFALFLVPLFFLSLINVALFSISQKTLLKFSGYSLITLTAGCGIIIIYTAINLSSSLTWRYDSNTKEMVYDLEKLVNKSKKITLGATWIFEPTINFYRETKSMDWLEPVGRDGLKKDYDFYYVDIYDLDSFDKTNKVLLKTYSESGASLFKKIK